MHASISFSILLCSVFLARLEGSIPGIVENEDGTGTLTMTAAVLGAEETFSPHMPSSLRCDACRILAHLLMTKFDKEHNKMKSVIEKKGRLGESDVIEIIDSVCTNSFSSVGVKEINKQNRLSGPGLETQDVPGVMQGGGKWPMRLQSMCATYSGDIGEEEIYQGYLEHKKNFVDFLCRGTGIQGDCAGEKKQTSNKSDNKEDKEKVEKEEDKGTEEEKEEEDEGTQEEKEKNIKKQGIKKEL